MDVVTIERTGEHFRILYDVKGRYQAHKIDANEAKFKLCSIRSKAFGPNKVPYVVTHDGRTLRFPHPDVKKHDSVKVRSPKLIYLSSYVCFRFVLSLALIINYYIVEP